MSTVLLETDGPLATVTLNRPHVLNAFDMTMLDDFETAVEALSRMPELRVVVIRGAGRAFSSGLDLNMRAGGVPLDFFERQEQLRIRLESMSAISIAVVHGYCLGGGLQLAIACDIRVAARRRAIRPAGCHGGHLPRTGNRSTAAVDRPRTRAQARAGRRANLG